MKSSLVFGPAEQTPTQRAAILARLEQSLPSLRPHCLPWVQALYARYVAGELSWLHVCLALETTPTSPIALSETRATS